MIRVGDLPGDLSAVNNIASGCSDHSSPSDDEFESSTSPPDNIVDNENVDSHRRNEIIEREEKHVRKVRHLLAYAILICTVAVSTAVYVSASRSEYRVFTNEVSRPIN
jgi:predicted nucleic acid-binding Zn ribbon protein